MYLLNKDTKKAQRLINSYKHYIKYGYNSLYDVYKNPSQYKHNALAYCKSLKVSYDGFNSCICGHNAQMFTYAFLSIIDNKTYLIYCTKDYNYMMVYGD